MLNLSLFEVKSHCLKRRSITREKTNKRSHYLSGFSYVGIFLRLSERGYYLLRILIITLALKMSVIIK